MRAILTAIGLTLFLSCAAIFAVFSVLAIATRPEAPRESGLVRGVAQKPLEEAIAESAPLRRLLQARARREAGSVAAAQFVDLSQSAPSPRAIQASAVAAVAAARAAAERGEQAAHAIYVPWPQERARGVAHLRLAAARQMERDADPLNLGPNARHERAIRTAARRTGLSPATLATLIDAEAFKRADGSWDPASNNPTSTALGLAQFVAKSWLHEAENDRRYLNRALRARGLITPEGEIPDKRAVLALRLEPRLSIITAAELAADNLVALARAGYAPKDDLAAARLAYLAHHEGRAGARRYLKYGIAADRAAKRLKTHLGPERYASLMRDHDGAAGDAYATWLETYIDDRIQPERFTQVAD